MQKHREEAQTADRRRMKDAARLADLQEMLPQQQVTLVLSCDTHTSHHHLPFSHKFNMTLKKHMYLPFWLSRGL